MPAAAYAAVACGPREEDVLSRIARDLQVPASVTAGADADTPPPGAKPQRRQACRRAVAVALASAAVSALGCAAWLHRGPRLRRARSAVLEGETEGKDSLLPSYPSRCGKMEANVEYQVNGGWYMSLDHIPSAEMCCAMCQGVEKCQAFTWVKDAGLDGCPSQCWLKGGKPTATPAKPGLVSGLPPPRAKLPATRSPPPAESGGSIFCFSLMVPKTYEQELLQFQHEEKTSIFGCDDWAVYSNITVQVAPGVTTRVVKTDLTVKFGGDSYSALNSWIFIAVWKRVVDDEHHKRHSWLVKVDPDAVFLPDRLRPIVAAHAGAGYINNCKYGLHGPIEVLSAKALRVLETDYKASFDGKAPKECVQKLHFGQWGEDFFLSRCLWQVHQVTRETESKLMCEAHCDCEDWYWCDSADRVTYHPFKRADMYKQCMANTLAAEAGSTLPAKPVGVASTA